MRLASFTFLVVSPLILCVGCGYAISPIPDPVDLSAIVESEGVDPATSTLLIERASDGARWVNNPTRIDTRFPAASTSKIPHTLIALETGAATADTIFEWDGQARFLDSWNEDQTLETAFQRSAVWVYQSIVADLGGATMETWLDQLDYGNEAVGSEDNLTSYWLDGTLRISAAEQVDFLHRLASVELPLSPETFEVGRPMMRLASGDFGDAPGPGWALYGKTGLFAPGDKTEIGWFVGWVEQSGIDGGIGGYERYAFAFNMDMPTRDDLPKRVSTVRAALAEIGAAPN